MSDVNVIVSSEGPLILPIVLRDSRNRTVLTIYKDTDGYFISEVDDYQIGSFDSLKECIEACFGHVYNEMQGYQVDSEKFWKLKDLLK